MQTTIERRFNTYANCVVSISHPQKWYARTRFDGMSIPWKEATQNHEQLIFFAFIIHFHRTWFAHIVNRLDAFCHWFSSRMSLSNANEWSDCLPPTFPREMHTQREKKQLEKKTNKQIIHCCGRTHTRSMHFRRGWSCRRKPKFLNK